MKACLYKSWYGSILGVVLILASYLALNELGVFVATGMFTIGAGLLVSYAYWRYLMSQVIYNEDFKKYRELLPEKRRHVRRFVSTYFVVLGLIFILLMATERVSQASIGQTDWWQYGVIGKNGVWKTRVLCF